MPHQVLARKWRPQKFQDLIGQHIIIQALTHALNHQRLHHAYLFTGTRGVGKTTIARIIAKALNCEQGISANPCGKCATCVDIENGRFVDLIEIDAASKTKVEDTRELLENVMYTPTRGRVKIYLIDEIHMLSGHSFNALLKTLEEPPKHVIFLLATTDPQKLPITVLSRCLQFQLKALAPEQIAPHLIHILDKENIPCEKEACDLIAYAAKGSVRDALSLLDQAITMGDGKVTYASTADMLDLQGQQLLLPLAKAILARNPAEALALTQKLADISADFEYVLEQLTSLFHDMSIRQLVPDFSATHLGVSEQELTDLASVCNAKDLQLLYQIAILAKRDLPLAPTMRVGFQMALLRMIAFTLETRENVNFSTPSVKLPLQASKEPAETSALTSNNWHEILPQLNLTAFAKTLADHLHFERFESDHYYFSLEEKNAPMLQEKHRQKMIAALSHYLKKPVQVTIQLGRSQNSQASLLEQRNEIQQQKEQALLGTFEQDKHLQKILSNFDGKILPESLTLRENK